MSERSTCDTNIVVYAYLQETKTEAARETLAQVDFLSVQALNEYASVSRRKFRRSWSATQLDLEAVRDAVRDVLPVTSADHITALRLAARYQLSFYDALMLAVALSGGARVFYSEDMAHDLWIDDTLRIVNPFLESQP